MGCGCNRSNKNKSLARQRNRNRRSGGRLVSTSNTPEDISNALPPVVRRRRQRAAQVGVASQMKRKRIEKLRREAIQRKFGK